MRVPEIDGNRLLVADLGSSSIPSCSDAPEIISWETMAETQQEQRAGIVCITGAPKRDAWNDFSRLCITRRLFPEWKSESILTDGSAMAVLWNPKYWHAEDFQTAYPTKSPAQRSALCFKLRRVTSRRDADEDRFLVILTKFHHGTAKYGHQFEAHDRTIAWKTMLEVAGLESSNKWLITGSLATQEVQLAMNIKENHCDLNPTKLFSSDKTITCVAQGIGLASCLNHIKKQILTVELDTRSSKSCDEDEGVHEHVTAFYDCIVKAMPKRNDDGLEALAPLLYGPRLPYRWAEDGILVLQAPTQKQCDIKLDFALNLIHEARYHAQQGGALTAHQKPADDHRKLSPEEMDEALEWLNFRYTNNYMPSLGHDPDFRSGFKTFLMDTIGDAAIAYAILRNGYSTPEALLALVREIYGDEHAGSRESYLVCKSRQAKVHPDLGAAAEKARREYVAGKNLKYSSKNYTRKYDTLNSKEQDILQRFSSGSLKRKMINANRAIGHGIDVEKSLTIEQMAALEMSFKDHGLEATKQSYALKIVISPSVAPSIAPNVAQWRAQWCRSTRYNQERKDPCMHRAITCIYYKRRANSSVAQRIP